jgi:hypothetical protein
MRRRAPTEVVEPFRRRKALQVATGLHEALAAWAKSNLDRLADAEPEMPPGLVDRPADVWEALLAVADLAGGSWSADARKAALELNRARIEADPSLGIALLRDIRTVFGNTDGLPTEELLRRLCALDESPWGDLRGKPLDARGLARRLRPYEVRPTTIRVGDQTPKGYRRADLHDAWARYLPLPEKAATSATAQQPQVGGSEAVADTVADGMAVSATANDAVTSDVEGVADVALAEGRERGVGDPGRLPGLDPGDPQRFTR